MINLRLSRPPGDSPFRTKGVVFQGVRLWFVTQQKVSYDTVCANLSEDLSSFLRQRFIAGNWYDYLPLFSFYREAAKLLGMTVGELALAIGRNAADRDLHGIYKFLLKLTSPQAAIGVIPRVWGQYFSFGKADVVFIDKTSANFRVHGFSSEFANEFSSILRGWIGRVLEHAGARDVLSPFATAQVDGEIQGTRTSRVEVQFRWK